MPHTFRDAITVARKLGIRFLWIDALCIVQPSYGDNTEWLEEGSRMGIIYENAICTIAATNPSIPITLPTSSLSFNECVTESALNRRGWVVQERALSKRVLHFTERGLFWECGTI
ncbi:hypothetical protein NA56DRAFT_570691, partial [Hyaloscypha hepaticicola]